jgi:hypothetical protein
VTDYMINGGTRAVLARMEKEWRTEVANLEPMANTVFGTDRPW